jgi:hypothetical protein
MKQYAVINENNLVINVVVADSQLETNWIEYTDEAPGYIGATWRVDLNKFIGKQPYPSWQLDEKLGIWQAPIEKPEGNYFWNELEGTWDETLAE